MTPGGVSSPSPVKRERPEARERQSEAQAPFNLRKSVCIARARALRRHSTWAEKLMWRWLRDRRFSAYKFRRQHPIGKYVLDFYCEEARLAIELDGMQHGSPTGLQRDRVRDLFLEEMGIKTLRFWNSTMRRQQQLIRDTVFRELQERAEHPLPAYTRPGILGRELASDTIPLKP